MTDMNTTALERISCPYCGESFDVVVDPSESFQEYIEDCYVCCRPMVLSVMVDEDAGIQVVARSENEC